MKRILIIPDVHLPLEDRKLVKAVFEFLKVYQPDEVIQLGDLMDFPQPSRWSKDTADEFRGSVFLDSDYAKARFLEPLREAYSGPISFIEGNHDERPRVYLARYAPALAESRAFHIDSMLDFDGFGIVWQPDFYQIAPGWIVAHGHKGGIRLSNIPGVTALNGVRASSKNVICGHSHRAGVTALSQGFEGNTKTLFGVDSGHISDTRLHTYLKGATPNWQQAIVTVTVDGDHVSPEVHYVIDDRFTVAGATYKVR